MQIHLNMHFFIGDQKDQSCCLLRMSRNWIYLCRRRFLSYLRAQKHHYWPKTRQITLNRYEYHSNSIAVVKEEQMLKIDDGMIHMMDYAESA